MEREAVKLSGHSPQLKKNSQELIKRGNYQTGAQSWAQGVKQGWFGHFTLLLPHRNGAAPAWNNGKADTKRKKASSTLSMPAQLRELVQGSPAAPTIRWSGL